jgi:spermidine/putrescine transport system substrate-binding protein
MTIYANPIPTILSRRHFLRIGCVAAGSTALLMYGCSSGNAESSTSDNTELTMLNYADWMGEDEIADFKDQTGITVEELLTPDGGNSAWVSTLTQNAGSYDFALAGNNIASQLNDNGLLAEFDASKVPNLANIPAEYRDSYPYGIPVEQGKIGFMYNTELMSTPPTSWKELFAQAQSLSGKILFPSYDGDVIAAGLLASGLDVNTKDVADIATAKKAVIAIKPYIKAFVDSGAPEQVVDGTAVLAVAYDYDFASASAESDKVAWVAPEEGMPAYLDGWVPLAASQNLDQIYEFMNFHLETEHYADFINTTCASWVMPSVKSELDPDVANDVALDPDENNNVIYTILSAEIQQVNASAWQEIQNA